MFSRNVVIFVISLTSASYIQGLSFISRENYNLSLQVSTLYGLVQGKEITQNGESHISYLGIPFARPPLGDLRFRSPQPPTKWKGVLDATKMRSGCMELLLKNRAPFVRRNGTENCLYINVYVPIKDHGRTKKPKLPVLFYIYGGAFMEGTSATYHPDFLLQQDLIVVTFNYRNGIFGFLSTEDEASYGNYALKDQFAALKWTNANIKKFGGDPDKVTIAGHSGGAYSASFLMLYPKSKGLFNAVISMSGDAGSQYTIQKQPRKIAFEVGLSLGIETQNSTELVERLREVDVEQLQRAQEALTLEDLLNYMDNYFPFSPIIEVEHEDAFLTKLPTDLLKKGEFVKVPLMMGMTEFELVTYAKVYPIIRPYFFLYQLSPSSFPNLLAVDSSKRQAVAKKVRRKYTSFDNFALANKGEIVELLNDLMFTRPITTSAMLMSKYIPVYFYVFNYRTNVTKMYLKDVSQLPTDISLHGVGHVEDLLYIWVYDHLELPPEGIQMRKRITKMWSNFARYGNPTPTSDPLLQNIIWPPINNTEDVSYLEMGKDFKISKNFRMEFVNFLNQLASNPEE